MKIVAISFLLLVAFPFHLMAQDSSDAKGKYFVHSPTRIQSGSNHIVEPTRTSNRKSSNQKFTTPQIKAPRIVTDFTSSTVKPVNKSSDVIRVAKLTPVPDIIQERIIEAPIIEAPIIEAPNVSAQNLNDVTRPTPSNTNPTISEPPAPAASPDPVGRSYQEFLRDRAQAQSPQASEMPERVSLDDIRMSQRGNNWTEAPVSQMRDIVDHFSPGGEPFAQRGIVGNPHYFGVDRNGCCDEWAGYKVCSGGLKQNPGHYGIPFLKSKDSCDPHTPLNCGCGRCKSKPRKTCGCAGCRK